MSSSVVAFNGLIHGRERGSNTAGKPLAQIPLWAQIAGRHTIVTSPFVYSWVSTLISGS